MSRLTAPPRRDPTYVRAQIDADPVWALAFRLSDYDNEDAPLGWSRYVRIARWLLDEFQLLPKDRS